MSPRLHPKKVTKFWPCMEVPAVANGNYEGTSIACSSLDPEERENEEKVGSRKDHGFNGESVNSNCLQVVSISHIDLTTVFSTL